MAEGGRKDKLGGRDRDGISGVVSGLRLVSVADGYLGSPVHCGISCWTGSGGDVRLQAENQGCRVDLRLLLVCHCKCCLAGCLPVKMTLNSLRSDVNDSM